MKSLEEENARLKRLVAELSLEKMVMSDVIKNYAKKLDGNRLSLYNRRLKICWLFNEIRTFHLVSAKLYTIKKHRE